VEPNPTNQAQRLSPAQIRAIYRQGEEAVVTLVEFLQDQIDQLRTRLKALEDRVAQNSRNSNRPPESEGLKKPPAPKNLRTPSGRPSGGQPGHPGHTLEQVSQPDHVVVHALDQCPCGKCGGRSLRGQGVVGYEKRQVFDLPKLRLEVTEHRAEVKCCPVSGQRVCACFPAEVQVSAQYGSGVLSFLVYLNQQQHIPQERLAQLCEDLLGQPLSEATLIAATQRTYDHLDAFEQAVVKDLREAPVVHVDESGLRVEGKLHWVHEASTAQVTFYGVHAKRGTEAMEDFAIIPWCQGWLIHDHWVPYFSYQDSPHALCNEHLLRELKFLAEEHQEEWAEGLSQLLLRSYRRQQKQGPFTERQFDYVWNRFHAWVRQGRQRHPAPAAAGGRKEQSKAANLLSRLERFDLCYLAFLLDPLVPFTNNQAEQDIRMVKVRQKISGCFRTLHGAQIFARIRGYLSTCRKQGHNLWEATKRAVQGQPFMPKVSIAAA